MIASLVLICCYSHREAIAFMYLIIVFLSSHLRCPNYYIIINWFIDLLYINYRYAAYIKVYAMVEVLCIIHALRGGGEVGGGVQSLSSFETVNLKGGLAMAFAYLRLLNRLINTGNKSSQSSFSSAITNEHLIVVNSYLTIKKACQA